MFSMITKFFVFTPLALGPCYGAVITQDEYHRGSIWTTLL